MKNKLLTLLDENFIELKKRVLSLSQGMVVYVLCAQWCGTCSEFKISTEELAGLFPDVTFIWIDIEDDNEVAGDIDVTNFPTLAVFREGCAVHYGVSLPHQGVVKRLLEALIQNPIIDAGVPEEVLEIPENLVEWLAEH